MNRFIKHLPLLLLTAILACLAGCATRPRTANAPAHAGLPVHQQATVFDPAEVPRADPADVGTIAGIVRAGYEVISGPPDQPRQWDRDRTLYTPGATFVSVWEEEGGIRTKIMTPEE
jgi:hypothetical protein